MSPSVLQYDMGKTYRVGQGTGIPWRISLPRFRRARGAAFPAYAVRPSPGAGLNAVPMWSPRCVSAGFVSAASALCGSHRRPVPRQPGLAAHPPPGWGVPYSPPGRRVAHPPLLPGPIRCKSDCIAKGRRKFYLKGNSVWGVFRPNL